MHTLQLSVVGSGITGRWERATAFALLCVLPALLLFYFGSVGITFTANQLDAFFPPRLPEVTPPPPLFSPLPPPLEPPLHFSY
jgi:hypothetical protein